MALRNSVFSATRALVATVGLFVVAACGGDGLTPPSGPAALNVTPASLRAFSIGQTIQLSATDESGNPVTTTITWNSENPAIATVDQNGLVTTTGFGTTNIRATAGSIVKEVTILVQEVQFNVNVDDTKPCANPILKSFTLQAQSAHLLIVSDDENPPGGFTKADYESFAATFESRVWPVLTENFGMPTDIDGNGKVIAFYTRAVNELTDSLSERVTAGFFSGRDLFPKVASSRLRACAGSNEAEMFYMLVPDPTGVVNGNVRTVDQVRRLTVGVLGHELQHLINAARRLYINQSAKYPEADYMEEGLSHIAEELIFYDAAQLRPRSNLGIGEIRATRQRRDAFNSYQSSNFSRLGDYMNAPSDNSPYQDDVDLATRGAAWSWLRYLADRGTPGTPVVPPACAAPVALNVGASCRIDGASAAQFGVTGGEFTIVAFAADLPPIPTADPRDPDPGQLTTKASASGNIAVAGPPNPSLAPSSAQFSNFGTSTIGGAPAQLQLDYSFHMKLRRSERRELPGRVAGARAEYAARMRFAPRMYSAEGSAPLFATSVFEPVWARLVNSNDTGVVNLRSVFGQDITGATRDWTVANYTDDAVAVAPTQYTHPSWNFRSIMPILFAAPYPLQVHPLTQSVTVTMTNGGAAYYRLGVVTGTTGTVSFTVNDAPPPSTLKLVVVRTK